MAKRRKPRPPTPPPMKTGDPFDFRPVLGTGPFVKGSDKWRGEPIKDPANPSLRPSQHYDDDVLGGFFGGGSYRGVTTPEFLMRKTTGPIPQQDVLVQQIIEHLSETRDPVEALREIGGRLAPNDLPGWEPARSAHMERWSGEYPLRQQVRRRGQ